MLFFRLTRIFYSDWSSRFSIFFRIVRIEMMTRVYMSGQIAKSDICASPKPPPEFDNNGHPTHKIALFVHSLVANMMVDMEDDNVADLVVINVGHTP